MGEFFLGLGGGLLAGIIYMYLVHVLPLIRHVGELWLSLKTNKPQPDVVQVVQKKPKLHSMWGDVPPSAPSQDNINAAGG